MSSDDMYALDNPFFEFDDFYAKWAKILTENCLPQLRESLSSASVTSTAVDVARHHLLSYLDTLNHYADRKNILDILSRCRRDSLEMPILFLGDIDPYLITSLIRSPMNRAIRHRNCNRHDLGAWKDPPCELVRRIEQIVIATKRRKCALLIRMWEARSRFSARYIRSWVSSNHTQFGRRQGKSLRETIASTAVDEAAKVDMEDLVSVFVDANLLRKSVIMDILAATSDLQAALFLEALCAYCAGSKQD